MSAFSSLFEKSAISSGTPGCSAVEGVHQGDGGRALRVLQREVDGGRAARVMADGGGLQFWDLLRLFIKFFPPLAQHPQFQIGEIFLFKKDRKRLSLALRIKNPKIWTYVKNSHPSQCQ